MENLNSDLFCFSIYCWIYVYRFLISVPGLDWDCSDAGIGVDVGVSGRRPPPRGGARRTRVRAELQPLLLPPVLVVQPSRVQVMDKKIRQVEGAK